MSDPQAFASSDPRHDRATCPACDRVARFQEDHTAIGFYAALDHTATGTLSASVSPAGPPDPHRGRPRPPLIAPRPHSGPMAGILSPVVQDRQRFVTVHDKLRAEGHDLDVDDLADCSACQTSRTTTRGFTYDLATLLGEGHYEEDPP